VNAAWRHTILAANKLRPLILPIAFVLGFGACNQDTAFRTDALIVCPGAEAVTWRKFRGTDQLAYRMKVEYPAEGTIACISKKLSENGWQPLKEDFWNPGLPSSHVRGWAQFADASVDPEATVDS
jgi:hypothetical protein